MLPDVSYICGHSEGRGSAGFSEFQRKIAVRDDFSAKTIRVLGEISSANRPETLLDATAGSCQVERRGTNRAGSATFWSSKPSGAGHLPEAGHVLGLASGRR